MIADKIRSICTIEFEDEKGIVECMMKNQIGIDMVGAMDGVSMSVRANLIGEPTQDPECIRREIGDRFRAVDHQVVISPKRMGEVEVEMRMPTDQLNGLFGLEYGELFDAMHLFGIGLWDTSDNCVR